MDLIISPHVDDEVLGCGGILSKNHIVLHSGLSDGFRHGDTIFSKDFRLQEFEDVKKTTGCETRLLEHPVNNYSRNKLIGDFEEAINEIKPEKIYIPNPSYNQDHKEVYDAALIALRPHDINFFVKKVLAYEQPQDFWHSGRPPFSPTHFIPIDITHKISLYEKMNSQVRGHRSSEHVKTIAQLRGMQSNYEYAEGFEVLRWIE